MPLFNDQRGAVSTGTPSYSVETEQGNVIPSAPPSVVVDTPQSEDNSWLGISGRDAVIPFLNISTEAGGHWADASTGEDFGATLFAACVAVMPVWVEIQPKYLTAVDEENGIENPNFGKTVARYRDEEVPPIKDVTTAEGYRTQYHEGTRNEIYRTFAYIFIVEKAQGGEVSAPLLFVVGRGSLPTARKLNGMLLRGLPFVKLTSTYEASKRNPAKKFWKFSKAEVWNTPSDNIRQILSDTRKQAKSFQDQITYQPSNEETVDE